MTKARSAPLSRQEVQELLVDLLAPTKRFTVQRVQEGKPGTQARPDFVAVVRDAADKGAAWSVFVEVKSRGEPYFLAQAADQVTRYASSFARSPPPNRSPVRVASLVIAPYVSELGASLLRQKGVNYADLAGNCWISFGPAYIERTGRPSPRGDPRRARHLFEGRAQVILRALLSQPKRVWKLLELSETTGLSLGYTHAILKQLTEETFVTRNESRAVAIPKPAALLEAWAKARQPSRDSTAGYFSFQRSIPSLERSIAEVSKSRSMPYALTMQSGAAFLAPFSRFSQLQMYVLSKDEYLWAKALDLRPTDTGANVVLRLARDPGVFYAKQRVKGTDIVCSPQLYVDLYNYPARGREQAEALREKVLKF